MSQPIHKKSVRAFWEYKKSVEFKGAIKNDDDEGGTSSNFHCSSFILEHTFKVENKTKRKKRTQAEKNNQKER